MVKYLTWTFDVLTFESGYTSIFAAAIIITIDNTLPHTFTVFRKASIKIIIIFCIIAKANGIFTLGTSINTVGVTWARFNDSD